MFLKILQILDREPDVEDPEQHPEIIEDHNRMLILFICTNI